MDKDRRSQWQRRSLLVLTLTILLAAIGACADGVERQDDDEAPAQSVEVDLPEDGAAAPTTAASRAYVDPQTGRLVPRPVAADENAPEALLPERLSRFQGDLVAVPLPDGGQSVDLRGRFRTDTVAHLDANGRLHVDCVDAHELPEAGTESSADEFDGGDHDN